MGSWEFCDDADELADAWAGEIAAAMRELGVEGSVIALDRLGTPGFLALQRMGFTFVDSAPTTEAAREVKTPEEVRLFRANGPLLMDMLGAFEAAIEPGVRERDLLAVLADRMHRGGGEFQATSTVASGPNTNPWRAEATDRALESGDLVFVDTDTVGIGGAFFCVSRTFPVGGGAERRPARPLRRRVRVARRDEGRRGAGPHLRRDRGARAGPARAVPSPALRGHGAQRGPRGGEPEHLLPVRPPVERRPRDPRGHGRWSSSCTRARSGRATASSSATWCWSPPTASRCSRPTRSSTGSGATGRVGGWTCPSRSGSVCSASWWTRATRGRRRGSGRRRWAGASRTTTTTSRCSSRPRAAPRTTWRPTSCSCGSPRSKTVKNRLHFDLRPDDQAAHVSRLVGLGATRADVGQTGERALDRARRSRGQRVLRAAAAPARRGLTTTLSPAGARLGVSAAYALGTGFPGGYGHAQNDVEGGHLLRPGDDPGRRLPGHRGEDAPVQPDPRRGRRADPHEADVLGRRRRGPVRRRS